ncbi:MAG TPA: integrase arm-type DNA-binding domain-containing protein [Halothiobacillus sp.]|nr:integrase arm-type DNA-binding domain-containing protein [Halothiobacillus sp.]
MAEKIKSAKYFEGLKTPGYHGDGGGLYLRIAEGRRGWFFRYKIGGRQRWMGLGPAGDVSLAEAREAATQARKQLKAGIDPLEAREDAKQAREAAAGQTFEIVAESFIKANKPGWRNEKHAAQWEATLKAYAYPVIGKKPVAGVTVADVLKIIEPIWTEKPETASRVRGRIENILDYATARKLRSGENPARWKGHLDHILPARSKVAKVVHHAALAWADLPATMTKLADSTATSAACLRFLVLTAARSGEARGARWGEIDMTGKVWTVPGDRMKAGRDHRVPLSAAALAVLQAIKPEAVDLEALVFEGGRAKRPLSDVAVSKALATVADGVTVHGMRSAFRDWCAERTSFPREISEAALAHSNNDKVEAAYLRGDHFEKRRRLMEQWGTFCTGTARTAGNVSSIRATA